MNIYISLKHYLWFGIIILITSTVASLCFTQNIGFIILWLIGHMGFYIILSSCSICPALYIGVFPVSFLYYFGFFYVFFIEQKNALPEVLYTIIANLLLGILFFSITLFFNYRTYLQRKEE